MVVKATFKDGLAVPDSKLFVPDGTAVEIVVPEPIVADIVEIPPELKAEFQFWEDLSADAWEKFLEWEREASE